MGQGNDLPYRIDKPEDIGDMGDTDKLCALGNKLRELLDLQPAGFIYRENYYLRALSGTKKLPRYDIGMVLRLGYDNFVTL